jgi:antitoxin PrlF
MVLCRMKLAQSRVTAQGQVSVPAEVRRRLGLAPGSMIEWDEEGSDIVVRRAHRYTSDDIHCALFPQGAPTARTLDELKEGIRDRMRSRYARR